MRLLITVTGVLLVFMSSLSVAEADRPLICLVNKTDANPFFVRVRTSAQAAAEALGFELRAYSGKVTQDHEAQVQAIETCALDGAMGILLLAADPSAIVPTVQRVRQAGVYVLALDTPLNPLSAADLTLATDNFMAGKLIGEWANERFALANKTPRIGLIDESISQPTVGVLRDQGFLTGMGIDIGDPSRWGDETDPRIIGHEVSGANEEGGRRAAETLLLTDPSMNLLYTINEPAAAGAYATLSSLGLADNVTVVSVDGSCAGVDLVKQGAIQATAMQFPQRMAEMGMERLATWLAKGGPSHPKEVGFEEGGFIDTGVLLITDQPESKMESVTSDEGLDLCWG